MVGRRPIQGVNAGPRRAKSNTMSAALALGASPPMIASSRENPSTCLRRSGVSDNSGISASASLFRGALVLHKFRDDILANNEVRENDAGQICVETDQAGDNLFERGKPVGSDRRYTCERQFERDRTGRRERGTRAAKSSPLFGGGRHDAWLNSPAGTGAPERFRQMRQRWKHEFDGTDSVCNLPDGSAEYARSIDEFQLFGFREARARAEDHCGGAGLRLGWGANRQGARSTDAQHTCTEARPGVQVLPAQTARLRARDRHKHAWRARGPTAMPRPRARRSR